MPIGEINTQVSLGETYGKKVGNIILLDAKFWGRPNFSGVEDRFKDSRRKFTVLIPNDTADQLRDMGYNVKTTVPTEEEKAEGKQELSHLKVMVDDNSIVELKMGDAVEVLTPDRFSIVDRARIQEMGMEIRAWEYDPEERPGLYSARLVRLVVTVEMNALDQRYGML
jgi:hypothetical protein